MKKLLSIMAVLFMAIINLKAQEGSILYTDFEPDTCVTLEEGGDIFTLDLNQDGNPDVFFSAYWHSAVGNIANMHVGNNWEFCDSDGGYPLTDTTIINNSLHWSHYSTDLAMYPERTHFAFRHQTEDGYHYGWAKIYVESLAKVCVSEMAYCTIPDYPLQWGQTEIPPQPAIIYTDYEPDPYLHAVYTSGEMSFDLNYDGISDFLMHYTLSSANSSWFEITVTQSNISLCLSNEDDVIAYAEDWREGFHCPNPFGWEHLGFRVEKDGDYYYGWFRIYPIHEEFNWYFDKLAFCTIPNFPLQWGQTTIPQGVEEETIKNGFAIYPNPANGVLFVETFPETSPYETVTQFETFQETSLHTYRITNMTGQTVLQGRITAETQQINIDSLPAGLYFISVGNMTQKFVVK